MRLPFFKASLIFMTFFFAYLQYVLWFKEDGILKMLSLKKELILQIQQNEQLKQKNQALYQQIERLKKDPEVTEGRARGELGMIKRGEKFYQLVK